MRGAGRQGSRGKGRKPCGSGASLGPGARPHPGAKRLRGQAEAGAMRCTQGCRGVKRDGVSSQRRGEKKGVHSGREGEAGRNNQIKQERALQKAGKKGLRGGKAHGMQKGPSGEAGREREGPEGKIRRTGEKWDGCAWRGGRARDGWEMWPDQIVSSKGLGIISETGFVQGRSGCTGSPAVQEGRFP